MFNVTNISHGNDSELAPVIYYTMTYRIIGTIVSILILTLGVAGNFLVIVVVLFSRNMRTTTNCYLVSLSVADLIVLFSATAPLPNELFRIVDEFVLGPTMCSTLVFLQYLGVNVSSLSISFFSIERWVAICRPIKAHILCTVSRALRIIAGLWIFSICYNCMWLYLAVLKTKVLQGGIEIQECTFRLPRRYYLSVYMFDLISFYCLPVIITCVLYLQIAKTLFRSSQFRAARESGTSTNATTPLRSKIQIWKERGQMIRMLMVVVFLFAILWLPYRSWVVYNSFSSRPFTDYWFILFARSMGFINSAINPILYNAMSAKFRRAFKRFLGCHNKCGRMHTHTRTCTGVNKSTHNRNVNNNTLEMQTLSKASQINPPSSESD